MPTGAAWAAFPARTARFPRRWWMVRAIFTSAATSPRRRCDCQRHRQMEREQLVGAGFGDEWLIVCLRWRCRAATCMRGAISRRRAAARPTNIAKWNGSSWSALGSGMVTAIVCVYALAVSGSDLYAGGDFTTAGGSRGQPTSPNGTGAVGRRWVRG